MTDFRRHLTGPGADIAVGVRLEPLDDVVAVGKAAAEEMREKLDAVLPGIVIAVVMMPPLSCRSGTVAMPAPGHPAAASLPASLRLSPARSMLADSAGIASLWQVGFGMG